MFTFMSSSAFIFFNSVYFIRLSPLSHLKRPPTWWHSMSCLNIYEISCAHKQEAQRGWEIFCCCCCVTWLCWSGSVNIKGLVEYLYEWKYFALLWKGMRLWVLMWCTKCFFLFRGDQVAEFMDGFDIFNAESYAIGIFCYHSYGLEY